MSARHQELQQSHRRLARGDNTLANRAGQPLLGATALQNAGAADQAIQPLQTEAL